MPSLYRRDAATSRAIAPKRVLDTLIPRRHAGEDNLANAVETEDEIEIETEIETETIYAAANLTVSRNTPGIITARGKRETAAPTRNASIALRRAPLRQGSAREAEALLGATLNRRSPAAPGVLGEPKTLLGRPSSPPTLSLLGPTVTAHDRLKGLDRRAATTDLRRLEIQGDRVVQGVQAIEPGRVLGVGGERHPRVETLLRILHSSPTRGVVVGRRYQTRIVVHRHPAVQVLDPGAAVRQLHLTYQLEDAPLQTLILTALLAPVVEAPKPADGKARALQIRTPVSIQRPVQTASR